MRWSNHLGPTTSPTRWGRPPPLRYGGSPSRDDDPPPAEALVSCGEVTSGRSRRGHDGPGVVQADESTCRSPIGRTSGWSPTTPRTPTPASRRSSRCGHRRGAERAGGADRRLRVRGLQRLRRPGQHPDRRAAGRQGLEVQPVPHHRAVLADPGGVVVGPQPPHGRDGRRHRDRHLGAWLQLVAAQHLRPAGRDAQAQRLLDRPVRQVPRGPGVADQPDGPVRQLALGRRWLRALLRVHRRRDQPVRPGDLPGHRAGGARPDPRGGLPLHRGHDRQGDRLDPPAEGADGRQAVLRLLRPRRHPRPPPRPARVVGPVQGPVRPGLGPAAGGDLRPPEGAGGHPPGRGADRSAGRDPGLGRHARGAQAGAGPPDGGLRRVPGAHRPPRRPAHRRPGRAGDPGRHPGVLHHRRQRRLGRGHPQRQLQRAAQPQRRGGAGNRRVHGVADRQVRHPGGLQPLRGRLGPRHGHPLSVDQAGRLPLGRDPQRHHRPLAGRDPGQGRGPQPVPPRDRRGGHGAGGGRAARADQRPRRAAAAPARGQHGLQLRRRRRGRTSARPSTSRCSATAASTTRAGRR